MNTHTKVYYLVRSIVRFLFHFLLIAFAVLFFSIENMPVGVLFVTGSILWGILLYKISRTPNSNRR